MSDKRRTELDTCVAELIAIADALWTTSDEGLADGSAYRLNMMMVERSRQANVLIGELLGGAS